MLRSGLIMAACVLAGSALAQDGSGPARIPSDAELVGDVSKGRVLAGEICSGCHEVRPGAIAEPATTPPAFSTIANTPGMTEIALTVWLTTFHPNRTMPGIKLSQDEREDIIAYILWLAEQ